MEIRRLLRYFLLEHLTGYTTRDWQQLKCSFSQFGEDISIAHLFRENDSGNKTYVDVGAYDPIYLSNTYYFYRLGWSGLVIDANPSVLTRYAAIRPRDQVQNVFVSNEQGTVDFTLFEADMFSTLSSNVGSVPLEYRAGQRQIRVNAVPLQRVIAEAGIEKFDLLNIDVEGNDFNVLQSLNFEIHRPRVICCEDHSENWSLSETCNFLKVHGYKLASRVGLSSIYVLR
jgi:FkbM family methyltransferase